MRNTRPILLLIALLVLGVAAWGADDPQLGSWKFNAAKSKYSPGPAPKEVAMKIEATKDGGLHLTQDGTDAAGKPIQTEFTGKCDGKDIPRRTIFAKRLIDR